MVQDIAPKKLINEYKPKIPGKKAKCLVFCERQALIKKESEKIIVPEYRELKDCAESFIYLFRIDDLEYYLAYLKEGFLPEGYYFENLQIVRRLSPNESLFAVITGYHLYVWYRDNRFCGRCGKEVKHDESRRMLKCHACKNEIYPKISPAVIVGVTDGDRILLTRYNGRAYKGYALIAGFAEIGETAEETVAREVLEETGVHVKNVTYYRSQPWGMESDLLLGFFAELDGSDVINLDEEELSTAGWYTREEIDYQPDDVSLTNDMIRAFLERK